MPICVWPIWIYWYIPRKMHFVFYPAALKGSGVLSYPEWAGGRAAGQTRPVNTLTSIIFHGSFSNLARTFITLRSRTSSIMEVLPHKNAHNGPFNEPASFGIPELIFQARVTKFGTKVGLNMLIDISSRFFHNRQKKILAIFFSIFKLRT